PMSTAMSGGIDSLLSIVQMPSGIPVGTMGVGKAGGANAALYAVSILALSDDTLADKLSDYRKEMALDVIGKNEKLQTMGWKAYIENMKK
ncbi:MAG: AIR carboxylase family protein, partial [Spirochaetota bacterium]